MKEINQKKKLVVHVPQNAPKVREVTVVKHFHPKPVRQNVGTLPKVGGFNELPEGSQYLHLHPVFKCVDNFLSNSGPLPCKKMGRASVTNKLPSNSCTPVKSTQCESRVNKSFVTKKFFMPQVRKAPERVKVNLNSIASNSNLRVSMQSNQCPNCSHTGHISRATECCPNVQEYPSCASKIVNRNSSAIEYPSCAPQIVNRDSAVEYSSCTPQIVNRDSNVVEYMSCAPKILYRDSSVVEYPSCASRIVNRNSGAVEYPNCASKIVNRDSSVVEYPSCAPKILNRDPNALERPDCVPKIPNRDPVLVYSSCPPKIPDRDPVLVYSNCAPKDTYVDQLKAEIKRSREKLTSKGKKIDSNDDFVRKLKEELTCKKDRCLEEARNIINELQNEIISYRLQAKTKYSSSCSDIGSGDKVTSGTKVTQKKDNEQATRKEITESHGDAGCLTTTNDTEGNEKIDDHGCETIWKSKESFPSSSDFEAAATPHDINFEKKLEEANCLIEKVREALRDIGKGIYRLPEQKKNAGQSDQPTKQCPQDCVDMVCSFHGKCKTMIRHEKRESKDVEKRKSQELVKEATDEKVDLQPTEEETSSPETGDSKEKNSDKEVVDATDNELTDSSKKIETEEITADEVQKEEKTEQGKEAKAKESTDSEVLTELPAEIDNDEKGLEVDKTEQLENEEEKVDDKEGEEVNFNNIESQEAKDDHIEDEEIQLEHIGEEPDQRGEESGQHIEVKFSDIVGELSTENPEIVEDLEVVVVDEALIPISKAVSVFANDHLTHSYVTSLKMIQKKLNTIAEMTDNGELSVSEEIHTLPVTVDRASSPIEMAEEDKSSQPARSCGEKEKQQEDSPIEVTQENKSLSCCGEKKKRQEYSPIEVTEENKSLSQPTRSCCGEKKKKKQQEEIVEEECINCCVSSRDKEEIPERTRRVSISSDKGSTSSNELGRRRRGSKDSGKLSIQMMPPVNIRSGLVMQRTLHLCIKPSGSVRNDLTAAPINVGYEEVEIDTGAGEENYKICPDDCANVEDQCRSTLMKEMRIEVEGVRQGVENVEKEVSGIKKNMQKMIPLVPSSVFSEDPSQLGKDAIMLYRSFQVLEDDALQKSKSGDPRVKSDSRDVKKFHERNLQTGTEEAAFKSTRSPWDIGFYKSQSTQCSGTYIAVAEPSRRHQSREKKPTPKPIEKISAMPPEKDTGDPFDLTSFTTTEIENQLRPGGISSEDLTRRSSNEPSPITTPRSVTEEATSAKSSVEESSTSYKDDDNSRKTSVDNHSDEIKMEDILSVLAETESRKPDTQMTNSWRRQKVRSRRSYL